MRAHALMMVTIASLVVESAAQTKPDLSGVWTMMPDKSDFGRLAAPARQTRTITYKEPSGTVEIVQSAEATGDTRVLTPFRTDGTPQLTDFFGSEMTTVGRWDGATLVLRSTRKTDQGDADMEDRYTLSAGGQTLLMTRSFNSPSGPVVQKIAFARK